MGNAGSLTHYRKRIDILGQCSVSADDDDIWDILWQVPRSSDDVFVMLQPSLVRKMRADQPANLQTLLHLAVSQLRKMIDPATIDGSTAAAMNCVRTLTRIFPFLLEREGSESIDGLFWAGGAGSANPLAQESNACVGCDTFGAVVVQTAIQLLFVPGLTLPDSASCAAAVKRSIGSTQSTRGGVPATTSPSFNAFASSTIEKELVWHVGAASSVFTDRDDGDTSPRQDVRELELDANRAEILKLLIALFCSPLFRQTRVSGSSFVGTGSSVDASAVQAGAMMPGASRFILCARQAGCPHGRELFFSLLNMALGQDPCDWFQSTLNFILPHAISRPERTKVSDAAMHVLLLLLDDRQGEPGNDFTKANEVEYAGSASDISEEDEVSKCDTQYVSDAALSSFRTALSQLHELADLDCVVQRIVKRLNLICESRSSSLAAERHHELLVLLWKLVDGNNCVMDHLLRPNNLNRLLLAILYLMYFERHDRSQAGMVHVCTFLLLRLSSERSFGFALNLPLVQQLRLGVAMSTDDTFGSFLVIVVTSIIVDGNAELDTLHGTLVTILANVSPFCRQLSALASNKLFDVLRYFTAPSFLSAQDSNLKLLSLLFEALKNFMHHQFDSNRELIYVTLTHRELLLQLSATLSLDYNLRNCNPDDMPHSINEARELQDRRPLDMILRLLGVLATEIERFCEQHSKPFTQESVMTFLSNPCVIDVGLLRSPESVIMRKYHPSEHVDLWFTTFIWGTIFLRTHESADAPMFDSSKITLFRVSHEYDTQ